jgi:flavin-dependent dehydrogenase
MAGRLARAGYDVTLLEKNPGVGGRMQSFSPAVRPTRRQRAAALTSATSDGCPTRAHRARRRASRAAARRVAWFRSGRTAASALGARCVAPGLR